jgi:hypothetical protein
LLGSCKQGSYVCESYVGQIFLVLHGTKPQSFGFLQSLQTQHCGLSQLVDHADIRFSPTEFLHVSTAFGSFHTNVLKAIDPHNRCLISFPASIILGRSAGVNAFAHPWPATSWAFPPACLLATALAYGNSTHAQVAFVCHISHHHLGG